MQVEVYFDILCPWCHIGKRKLTTVLAGREDAEVLWRSLELDPEGSSTAGPTAAVRADERSERERGVRGVPTLIVDGGVAASAVQDPDTLARLLSSRSDG